ncbi:EAL domain-containing protein [Thiocapsa bogorovii]|uniref:EAL domain-containing protein n=1 Tax=Thiocapsa bogorovii TaxID=521689 RepID=UPI001E5960FB|nr:sensor domain-containing phosphodiesterase [Thiocapsa bogorovii]UHD16593.1 sensor domain-containing phosphodiesterase [Thiocapsa bogorovii]
MSRNLEDHAPGRIMSAQPPLLALLLLTADTAASERLVERLRATGLAARALVTARADRLNDLLARRAFDMILWWRHDGDQDLADAIRRRGEHAAEIPLIIIAADAPGREQVLEAQQFGARGLVALTDEEQLLWTIRREASDLRQRRRYRELAARLKQCERRSRELVDHTGAAIAYVQQGLHLYANSAYLALLGYPNLDEIQSIALLDLVDPEQRDGVRDLLQSAERAAHSDPVEITTRLQTRRGKGFEARLSAAQAVLDDEPCLQLILDPARQSESQAMTGDMASDIAAARTAFFEEIEARLAPDRAVPLPFAVFFIRLRRHSELLRDLGLTHGLDIVDDFGPILASVTAQAHAFTRISDDGFAMIVDGLDEKEAEALAEHIREHARLPQRLATSGRIAPDCDIGYYLVKGRAAAAQDILNAAHRLCVYSAAAPGDCAGGMQTPTSLAARTKQTAVDGDTEVADKIATALGNEQFKLVYQPIISLMGDNQENYSVLVRLLDEKGELLEAKDFIGAAIRRGLIEEIDKWAIRDAVRVLAEQRRAGHNLRFFINLAEDTFRNPSIILHICDCLRELDVRGNWLAFQFQEELVAENLASLGKLIEALKQIKCRVAINRFGATNRSEMILQALPVDFVVLMPDFARALAEDPVKQQRLMTIADLAREFNVKSVVTGVEDARALTVLWTAGVDYVQGNFLQRPSPTLDIQP